MTSSNLWVSLWVLVLAAPFLPAQGAADGERGLFHWKVVPGTRRCELYVSDHRIGLWDADEQAYYRINADGTVVGPVPPPFPIRSHSGRPLPSGGKQPPPKSPEIAPREGEEAGVEQPWYQDMPPWVTYAIGGGVTLLITCVGMGLQFRRR